MPFCIIYMVRFKGHFSKLLDFADPAQEVASPWALATSILSF